MTNKRKDNRPVADIPLPKLTITQIEILCDRKRDVPFAADERLKVFDTKRDGKAIVRDIVQLVRPFNAHRDGHAAATPDDIEKFISLTMAPAPTLCFVWLFRCTPAFACRNWLF